MVTSFARPGSAAEALGLKEKNPGSAYLAGGTFLLTAAFREARFGAISVEKILPSRVAKEGDALAIGAMATFQDLLDSPAVTEAIKKAAAGMTNRIVRNRATIGGNIGANKSCSSLVPVFIALGAEYELARGGKVGAEAYAANPGDLVVSVRVPLEPGRATSYQRWARVSCDLSVITATVSAKVVGGKPTGLRVVLGGMAARAARFPSIEALFDGKALPDRETMDAMIEPELHPIDDIRASAAFKRHRAARMVSDAILEIAGGSV